MVKGIKKNVNDQLIIENDYSVDIINEKILELIDKKYDDFWIRLGAKAGLLYYAIYKDILKNDYKKIFFLARDGYNLYNLFKKYSNIETEYVYTSKRALLLASITKIEDKVLNFLPPYTFGQTIREVLEYVGMEKIFSIDDLKEIGFNSFEDKILNIQDLVKFKSIYRLKEADVLKICKQERVDALRYFNELGMRKGTNFVFDFGWDGSCQYFLENLMRLDSSAIDFEFYHAGVIDSFVSKIQLANRKYKSFMFDIDNQSILGKIGDCIVLLEMFFDAPEQSVYKYDKNGFVFDEYEKDLEYKKGIYKGIELFFDYIIPLDKNNNYEINVEMAMKPIIRLIMEPTLEEAIKIGNLEYYNTFTKQKSPKKYIAKLSKEDIDSNNVDIFWKYGLLKRNDIDEKVKEFVKNKYKMNISKRTKASIYGLNNPLLNITIVSTYNSGIRIVENGKDLAYENHIDYEEEKQVIEVPLQDKSDIDIYLKEDNEEILFKTIHNRKLKRLIGKMVLVIFKLLNIPKKIIRSIIEFFGRIGKAVGIAFSYLWKKYHLLVPPTKLKKEIRNIKKILVFDDDKDYADFTNDEEYRKWLKFYDTRSKIQKLDYNPLISFVIPVYNVSRELLSECLDSILNQTYKNIEICLADDCSKNEETIETLKEYENKDERIKVVYRKENGHISRASNSALELATGEYVAMMDNDDTIPEHAVYELVKVLNEDKTIDLIYTDEDKLDEKGLRCHPHMKSDFAPDTLMSLNYFCHFTLLRTSILREIGGWKPGYEGAQDWDLFLRFTERTKKIYHLPKILYHWRMAPGSTSLNIENKDYVDAASRRLLSDALNRRGVEGIVHLHPRMPHYWIEYLYKKEPKISIIIPTKDYASTLRNCLESIYNKTAYTNYEVIVVDNRSEKQETFDLFDEYGKKHKNFKVLKADMEFNYSKINNLAVKEAKGDFVLLLNNDIEVISEKWLSLMVGYAMQSHIGAVGTKLIFPDKTIQHGGIVLGVSGVACHSFLFDPLDSIGFFCRLLVPYNYSAVTGACLMINKKKYEEVNGLNEDLKVAFNDIDFCLKLQKAGYYNVLVPMVELYHYESKSRGYELSSEKKKRFEKEKKYILDNWSDVIKNDPMYNENLSRTCAFQLRKDDKNE